jgi:hypothetical protein
MIQRQYVIDKDLLTNSKKFKILRITRHDSLVEYLASRGGERRD